MGHIRADSAECGLPGLACHSHPTQGGLTWWNRSSMAHSLEENQLECLIQALFGSFFLCGIPSHLLLPLLCAFNFSLKVNFCPRMQVEKKWVTIWNWPWKNMLPPKVTAACPTRLTMFLLEWARCIVHNRLVLRSHLWFMFSSWA